MKLKTYHNAISDSVTQDFVDEFGGKFNQAMDEFVERVNLNPLMVHIDVSLSPNKTFLEYDAATRKYYIFMAETLNKYRRRQR